MALPEAPEGETGEIPKHAAELLKLHVVSSDHEFAEKLAEALQHEIAAVEIRGLGQAGVPDPGEPHPIVLIDLRQDEIDADEAASLHRARPRASFIALVEPGASFVKAYGAGALAALPAEVETVVACVENVIESRRDLIRGVPREEPSRAGVERLRRVYGDLRSGLISATVALNLMHIISESVERAVLFLVKRDHLVALGAFGTDTKGCPLAESTRTLRLDLIDTEGALMHSLESGEVQATAFEDAGLPEVLEKVLGRPRTGQIVVFPVLGAQRVISVIYADNGDRDQPIEDIDILELATAQVGMAFENELLRRQISQGR